MIGLFAATALTIAPGSLHDVFLNILAHLQPNAPAVIWGEVNLDDYVSRGVTCTICSAEGMFSAALAGTPLILNHHFDPDGFETYVICRPSEFCKKEIPKCQPKLGARAPLPPCEGKSLEVGVTDL